jgi:hypothetical protein
MSNTWHPELIETTAGEVAAELGRRGVAPDAHVTGMISIDQLVPGRAESRARVLATGLSDDDIDRMIKQAQHEVEPRAV